MKAAVGMIPKTSSTLHFLFLVASTFLDITSLNAANVSEFGFDPADSTEIIQRALDSGVHQLVFDRQAGPWVTRPLFVRSNTEIVFEDGVELVAKRGEFHGIHDRLLELGKTKGTVPRV